MNWSNDKHDQNYVDTKHPKNHRSPVAAQNCYEFSLGRLVISHYITFPSQAYRLEITFCGIQSRVGQLFPSFLSAEFILADLCHQDFDSSQSHPSSRSTRTILNTILNTNSYILVRPRTSRAPQIALRHHECPIIGDGCIQSIPLWAAENLCPKEVPSKSFVTVPLNLHRFLRNLLDHGACE